MTPPSKAIGRDDGALPPQAKGRISTVRTGRSVGQRAAGGEGEAARTAGEEEASHAHDATEADRCDVRLDVLHRVVQREARHDVAAGRVDVDRDILLVLGVQVQHRRD